MTNKPYELGLYDQLLTLTQNNEAFYFKDYTLPNDPGFTYRVFNYRLANYTDFLLPGALESRGTTFLLDENMEPQYLVCRPWKKFFNLGENPFTIGLDLSYENIEFAATKADGSLISTFCNPITGFFGVKSKQDFFSDQAIMAKAFLSRKENREFNDELNELALWNYTVIMELVSPLNRIVLPYQTTELKVLGVRHNITGDIVYLDDDKGVLATFPEVKSRWVEEYYHIDKDFIDTIPDMIDIEGYVVTLSSGLMFKCKTEWYKALHHLKDSVSSSRRLFEAIILETVDDVKTMFPGDEAQLTRISYMEEKVIPKFNHLIKTVEDFYEKNKGLDRKSFAILGQSELGLLFNLAMMKYLGKNKDSSYREFAIKYRKEYFDISEVTYEEE